RTGRSAGRCTAVPAARPEAPSAGIHSTNALRRSAERRRPRPHPRVRLTAPPCAFPLAAVPPRALPAPPPPRLARPSRRERAPPRASEPPGEEQPPPREAV